MGAGSVDERVLRDGALVHEPRVGGSEAKRGLWSTGKPRSAGASLT